MTMKWMPFLASGIGLLWAMSVPAAVKEYHRELEQTEQTIWRDRHNLENIHQRLQQEKKLIGQKRRKERSLLFEIEQVDKRIEEAKEDYLEHQHNLQLVQEQIQQLQSEIVQTESEIQRLKQFLAFRLRLLYRERLGGFWLVLVSSQNLAELLRRLKFFHALSSQNAHLIKRLKNQSEIRQRQNNRLVQRGNDVLALQNQARQTLNTIQVQRQTREVMLFRIRHQRSEHEQAVKELAAASQRLNLLLIQLQQRAQQLKRRIIQVGEAFGKRRHNLPWPTRGRVLTIFGKTRYPRFNTYIYNKGIDIQGSIGQNIYSVASGYVLFAEWFEGYGRMVILDHGGGYNTVYAHLNTILLSTGDKVEEHQIIGHLGDSGTWKGPLLYFEIRFRGTALDPLRWLE